MPIVADAAVKVGADMSGFNRELKGADKGVQTLGQRMKSVLNPKTLATGFAGGFLASEAFQLIGGAINAAAEFQDTVSATGVIIGTDLQAPMEEWAETAASAFGASKQDALAAANQMAVFGKAAGLAGDDLMEFATGMTELGGDLASMFGGSTEDAITAVGAALRGESEPIRRYGVLLDDATLRQRAFEMGITDTISNALTPQQRVLAAQAEIMAQTADAQGDFARTSDGMANTQRVLAAEMENLNIEIGEKLLPLALDLAIVFRDDVIPTLASLIEIAGHVGGALATVGDVLSGIQDAGIGIHEFFFGAGEDMENFADTAEGGAESVGESMTQVNNAVATNMGGVRQTFVTEGATIRAEWEGTAQFIPDAITARWQDTRDAAFEMAVQHALGILDGQDDLKVAFEALTRLQEEEQTKAQRIAYLQGLLNSTELAAGLEDPRAGVSGAAAAVRGQIVAELATLGVDAYNSGLAVSSSVAAGIYANAHLADGASSYLAAKISGYLPRSEPKTGPLRGITKVGDAIVHSITDGIYGNLADAGYAASALAGALVPGVGVGSFAGAAGVAGDTRIYQLYVEGKPKSVGDTPDALRAFDSMERF